MRMRRGAIPITIAFAVVLAAVVLFQIDISSIRDIACDGLYRDAGQCRGERFLDPSPFAIWLPSDLFVWDSIRSGHLPLWERLQGGGYSPMLTFYNGVFHPVRLVSTLTPRGIAPSVFIILSLYAGFLGTYLLARTMSLSEAGALLAAFAFTFSSGLISFAEFSGCLLPVVHLPWILYLLKTRRYALAAIAIALLIISGHPAFIFCAIAAIAGVAIGDAIAARRVAPLIEASSCGVAGALLAAFALLPPYLARGELWSYKTKTYFGSSYGLLHWDKWTTTIWAALVAQPHRWIDADSWYYIGIAALVMAAAGLYRAFRVPHYLTVFALLFLFLCLAYPGDWMAGVADIAPVKYLKSWYVMGEVSFFLAIAIGLGFDELRGGPVRMQWLAAGFACWIILIYGWRAYTVLDPIRLRPLPETEALRFLRSQPDGLRMTGLLGQTHTPNSSRISGIEDIRISQPVLLTRYVDWWTSVDRNVRRHAFPTTRITDELSSPLVAHAGVAYVVENRYASTLTFHTDPDPLKRDRELSPKLASFPLALRTESVEIRRNPAPISARAEFVEGHGTAVVRYPGDHIFIVKFNVYPTICCLLDATWIR